MEFSYRFFLTESDNKKCRNIYTDYPFELEEIYKLMFDCKAFYLNLGYHDKVYNIVQTAFEFGISTHEAATLQFTIDLL